MQPSLFKKYFIILFTISFSSYSYAYNFDRVLFIGDSHSYGEFGTAIDNYFRELSPIVTTISICGSSPSNWVLDTKSLQTTNCGFWKKQNDLEERTSSHTITRLKDELLILKPNLVVVSLGTNIIGKNKSGFEQELNHIQTMFDQISQINSHCIWIGPPDLARKDLKQNLKERVELIKSKVENNDCAYIDSTLLISYPQNMGDGVHYGPKNSRKWATSVIEIIESIISNLKE